MKILNLYAGIGGNRKLWGDDHEITAVEYDERIADIYKENFPDDNVPVMDALEYMVSSCNYFDFIWASPPCPTHSRARYWGWSKKDPILPDMSLYQIIIFLKHHFDGKWVVENVTPYYEPLIPPTAKVGRHLFWGNFKIPHLEHKSSDMRALSGTSFRDKLERNKVDPEIGLHILNAAQNIITKQNEQQINIFE